MKGDLDRTARAALSLVMPLALLAAPPGGPDATITVSGHIVDKYMKRGRPYLWYYLEVRTSDGRLVTTYNDLTVLRYRPEGEGR